MSYKKLLTINEDKVNRLTVWPPFILAATLITVFAATLLLISMVAGYGLRFSNKLGAISTMMSTKKAKRL